jgi:hypothetical protein
MGSSIEEHMQEMMARIKINKTKLEAGRKAGQNGQ